MNTKQTAILNGLLSKIDLTDVFDDKWEMRGCEANSPMVVEAVRTKDPEDICGLLKDIDGLSDEEQRIVKILASTAEAEAAEKERLLDEVDDWLSDPQLAVEACELFEAMESEEFDKAVLEAVETIKCEGAPYLREFMKDGIVGGCKMKFTMDDAITAAKEGIWHGKWSVIFNCDLEHAKHEISDSEMKDALDKISEAIDYKNEIIELLPELAERGMQLV